MRRRHDFIAGLALGFLFASAVRALLSTLFYLSLVTLRLNETAAWMLILAAPALAPFVARGRWPIVVLVVGVAALPFVRFTNGFVPFAALAAGAGALALAWASRVRLAGAVAGLALNGAALLLAASQDPLLSTWGAVGALLVGVVAWRAARPPRLDMEPAHRRWTAGIAWGCLIAVELAFFASPYIAARETDAPAWGAQVASIAGLALGFLLVHRAPRWLPPIGGAIGLIFLMLTGGGAATVPLLAVQAGLGAAATRLPRPHGVPFGLTLAALLFTFLFFGQPLGSAEWQLVTPIVAIVPLLSFVARPNLALPPRRTAALLAVGLLTVPLAMLPISVADHEGDVITVVSWNVHQGFGNRGGLDPALYATVLREINPDIVMLQEADTARLSSGGVDMVEYLARETGLHIASGRPGVAILSRFLQAPGLDIEKLPGWSTSVPLDVHGTTVWVQSVHLARTAAERARQVSSILESANATAGPRILGGDLNSCATPTCFGGRPSDGVQVKLALAYQDTWDAQHDPSDPAGNTHPAHSPVRRIDVVLARGVEVISSGPRVDEWTRLGSDHLPVVAKVRLPERP